MGKWLSLFMLLLAFGIYAYKIAAPVSGRQNRPGLPTTTITAAPGNRYKPGAARLLAIKERIRKQGSTRPWCFLSICNSLPPVNAFLYMTSAGIR